MAVAGHDVFIDVAISSQSSQRDRTSTVVVITINI